METNILSWVFLGIIVAASAITVVVIWLQEPAAKKVSALSAEEIERFMREARENQPSNSELFSDVSCHELIVEGTSEMLRDGYRLQWEVNINA